MKYVGYVELTSTVGLPDARLSKPLREGNLSLVIFQVTETRTKTIVANEDSTQWGMYCSICLGNYQF